MSIARRAVFAIAIVVAGCGSTTISRPQITINADPQVLNFGNQPGGSSTSKTVTLRNDGLAILVIASGAITGDTRGAFSVGPLPKQLSPATSATFQVTYAAPDANGADGASLTISSNADNAPQLSVSLSAQSLAACPAETDSAFCTRAGKNCGSFTAADNCGANRTVTTCGSCAGVQTCNGNGVANVCGTPVFPVTVTLAGTGSGSVASSPGGISCGSTCSASFESGSTVTLSATPGSSSVFSGFSGACSGQTCSLSSLSAAKTVIATFAALPSLLVFTQQPANTTSGATFSPAVTVAVEDASGNVVTTSNATITLTPSAGALSGSSSVAAVNGIATFDNLSMALAGGYTLTAATGNLTSAISRSFTISAGLATQLVFTRQPPTTAQSGIAMSLPVMVSVEDGAGNVVTTSTLAISMTPSGGTLTGGSQNATSGVATFSLTLAGTAGSGYALNASSNGLSPATSTAITLSAGTATQIVFTQQPPTTAQSGIAMSQSVKVSLEDANGNAVITSSAPISLASSGGSLTGGSSQNASSGVATFSLTLAATAGNYTLNASSSGFTSVTSNSIALSAGTATQLVFGAQPTSTTSNTAISPAVTVTLEDAAGNLTASTATVAITTSPSTTLSGIISVAAVGGVATFSNLSIAAANTYTLGATSGSLTTATSSPFIVTGGVVTVTGPTVVPFGGAGDQLATGIVYASGAVWVSGNQSGGLGGIVAKLTLPLGAAPDFMNVWPASGQAQDYFYGIAAGPSAVYAVGQSYSMTTDSVGGKEGKMAIVKYPLTDNASTPAPSGYEWFPNVGGSAGIELLAGGAVLVESGTTYVYGAGMAQYPNRDTLIKASDPAGSPTIMPAGSSPVWTRFYTTTGNSGGNGVTAWANGGGVYSVGSDNDTTGGPYPILAAYDTTGKQTWAKRGSTSFAYQGSFQAVAASGTDVYAVGLAYSTGGTTASDYVVEKYDTSGTRQWTKSYDSGNTNDVVTGVVVLGSSVYAVGYTGASTPGNCAAAAQCKAVLLQISTTDGTLQSTTTYGTGATDQSARGITTDGTDLFVVGHGQTASNGYDIFVLRYTLTAGSVTTGWTQLAPTGTAPSARYSQRAALDVANNKLIVFGGADGNISSVPTLHNDTWVLGNADGSATPSWAQLLPTGTLPQARGYPVTGYDPGSNGLVMFGGNHNIGNCFQTNNDTWILSNANGTGSTPAWTQLSPASPPSVRNLHTGVYDTANHRMIVFAGQDACGPLQNDTWVLSNIFSGTPTWTKLSPTGTLPAVRSNHLAVYDQANNRMIIWGGQSDNQTWVLSNANGLGGTPAWAQLSPTGTLPTAQGNQAVYDPAENEMIMFAGSPSAGASAALEAWLLTNANGLDGTPAWQKLAPPGGPAPQTHDFAMWFQPGTNRATAWGGQTCASNTCALTGSMWTLTSP